MICVVPNISFLAVIYGNNLNTVSAYVNNTDSWVVGKAKTVDGMSDQANITNFQNNLMIGDSIFPKAIEQCNTEHVFQVTFDVIDFWEAIFWSKNMLMNSYPGQ